MIVNTYEELITLSKHLATQRVIAVDTEFMREKTYYAKLCLIQISDEQGEISLIDPIALEDISPLKSVMCNPNVLKVFHAGGQDLEIFYQIFGEAVYPIFDTQSAASLLGYRDQIGYGALVLKELDVQLSKADSFTDWSKRPLEKSQIEYAADDVVYLMQMFPQIIAKLHNLGRQTWLDEEFRQKEQNDYFEVDWNNLFRRVKKVSSLSRRQLAVARYVTIWREKLAQERNIPKKWVCGDETLVEIARRSPQNIEKVKSIRGVTPLVVKNAASLFDAIQKGKELPEDELPEIKRRQKPVEDLESHVDLMMALVRQRAKDNNIATTQLASRSSLEHFAENPDESHELMQGWRKAMVGIELLDLLEGNLSLSLKNGSLAISRTMEENDDI